MKIFIAGALAIVVVVVALIAILAHRPVGQAAQLTGTGIPGAGPVPDWLKTADKAILADYAWAAEHYEDLRWIPCYCGCNSVGHDSNAACYFRWSKDGKINGYDNHALS